MNYTYISILSSAFLCVLKFLTAGETNSISLFAESIHSSFDVASALSALFFLRLGKENLAPKMEGALLFMAGLWLLAETVLDKPALSHSSMGILVSLISLVVYLLTYRAIHKASFTSLAIRSNLIHIISDIGSTILILLGFIAVYFTGVIVIDKIVAFIVIIWLFFLSYFVSKIHNHE